MEPDMGKHVCTQLCEGVGQPSGESDGQVYIK